MNLMIILVPVLLMSMVFARTTILDLQLPNIDRLQADPALAAELAKQTLEVVISDADFRVSYPAGVLVKQIPLRDGTHDYLALSTTLQEIKQRLALSGVEKRDIQLLSQPSTNYQTLVTTMDTSRSYVTLLGVAVVDAEFFPEIALGDAPALPVLLGATR